MNAPVFRPSENLQSSQYFGLHAKTRPDRIPKLEHQLHKRRSLGHRLNHPTKTFSIDRHILTFLFESSSSKVSRESHLIARPYYTPHAESQSRRPRFPQAADLVRFYRHHPNPFFRIKPGNSRSSYMPHLSWPCLTAPVIHTGKPGNGPFALDLG